MEKPRIWSLGQPFFRFPKTTETRALIGSRWIPWDILAFYPPDQSRGAMPLVAYALGGLCQKTVPACLSSKMTIPLSLKILILFFSYQAFFLQTSPLHIFLMSASRVTDSAAMIIVFTNASAVQQVSSSVAKAASSTMHTENVHVFLNTNSSAQCSQAAIRFCEIGSPGSFNSPQSPGGQFNHSCWGPAANIRPATEHQGIARFSLGHLDQ